MGSRGSPLGFDGTNLLVIMLCDGMHVVKGIGTYT
jgi:hypothetical protein